MQNFKNSLQDWLLAIEAAENQRAKNSPAVRIQHLRLVAERLNLLPYRIPVITVAGTNGKGSTVIFLASIYKAAGYRVGHTLSPHMFSYNERIQVNGIPVSDQIICDAFEQIERASGNITLGYFQIATLAALIIFEQANLDVVVLEVGLGGIYDAVNILDADVAVITSIGIDHVDRLGKTRESIALNKAGIMRKGKPIVCGDWNPPSTIFSEAKRIGAPLYYQGRDFSYRETADGWDWESREGSLSHLPKPTLNTANASTALMVVKLLNAHLPLPDQAILTGIRQAFLHGRCELVDLHGVKILLDVAHSAHAMVYLTKVLQSLKTVEKRYIVIGMLKDKDIEDALDVLRLVNFEKWFLASLKGKRGEKAERLEKHLKQTGVSEMACYADPTSAFKAAYQTANKGDLIVVTGSFHMVVPVMECDIPTANGFSTILRSSRRMTNERTSRRTKSAGLPI